MLTMKYTVYTIYNSLAKGCSKNLFGPFGKVLNAVCYSLAMEYNV